jgi:anti-sigma factor RsiW
MARHIDEESLDSYAMGRLAENESAPIEEHLLVCGECQERVADTDQVVSLLRAAAPLINTDMKRARYRQAGASPRK